MATKTKKIPSVKKIIALGKMLEQLVNAGYCDAADGIGGEGDFNQAYAETKKWHGTVFSKKGASNGQ